MQYQLPAGGADPEVKGKQTVEISDLCKISDAPCSAAALFSGLENQGEFPSKTAEGCTEAKPSRFGV